MAKNEKRKKERL